MRLIANLIALLALLSGGVVSFGQVLQTLAAFNGSNGSDPSGGLIMDANGNLYGTASYGAANNLGCVFELPAGSHTLATLGTFTLGNGSHPTGSLLRDAGGNLFGTTYGGSGTGNGSVYEIPANTQTLTTLILFNGSNGANADGGLIADPVGNLYGTTQVGGAFSHGTVFELSSSTHVLTTLVSFNGSNGLWPSSGVVRDANGNLFGTTPTGGANNVGTVFEIDGLTHSLSTLATFNVSDGSYPWAGLFMDSSGNLYGTTAYGGANDLGTVFKIDAATHTLTTLFSFYTASGSDVEAGVVMGDHGDLFGTTAFGGDYNLGTVFKLNLATGTMENLVSFNSDCGGNPYGGLLIGPDGNLYGTTAGAGAYPNGTVFEISLPDTGLLPSFGLLAVLVLRPRRATSSARPGKPDIISGTA